MPFDDTAQRLGAPASVARRAAITAARTPPNPSGLCLCGCGQKTAISKTTALSRGDVRGHPRQFVHGHHSRPRPPYYDVDPETGCWLWRYTINKWGYGRLKWEGKLYQAHRWMYERLVGPIPEGLELDHVRARGCRHKHCVNPTHLEPVTRVINARRGRGTKLTQEQIAEIGATIGTPEAIADIAVRFGVSPTRVYQIRAAHCRR